MGTRSFHTSIIAAISVQCEDDFEIAPLRIRQTGFGHHTRFESGRGLPQSKSFAELRVSVLECGSPLPLWLLHALMSSTSRAFLFQFHQQLVERQGVYHIALLQPAFSGDAGAEPEKARLLVAVSVAVNHTF